MTKLIEFIAYIGICVSALELRIPYFMALIVFTIAYGMANYKQGKGK